MQGKGQRLFDREWEETEALLGKIVMTWGDAMSLVYGLPQDLGFESPAAIQLCLANANGDGSRISQMKSLLRHEPILYEKNAQRKEDAIKALSNLEKLIPERDSLIHGVPTKLMKRDIYTMETVRLGVYMIQQRKWNEDERFIKVPEAAEAHLEKLKEGREMLLRVAKPMLFEDWEAIFGDLPSP